MLGLLSQFLPQASYQLAGDGGELLQKLLHAISRFQVIKQGLHGHARPRKTSCAMHNIRIGSDDGIPTYRFYNLDARNDKANALSLSKKRTGTLVALG